MFDSVKFILIVFLSIIFSFYSSVCQISNYDQINDYDVSNLSSELNVKFKGLSHNSVRDIVQDSRGYMWFGTREGLNRFDGLNFLIYSSEYGVSNKGLSNSSVFCLYADSEGFLWIGTDDGLNWFDPVNREFEVFKNEDNSISLSNNAITSIVADFAGNLWVGTENGLNRIDKITKEIEQYYFSIDYQVDPDRNHVSCLFVDHAGELWVGASNGLYKYNTDTNSFACQFNNADPSSGIPNDLLNCICEDENFELWIGTGSGIAVLDSSRTFFKKYYKESEDNFSLSSNIISSILKDSQGSLWIGTYGFGLNMYNRELDNFINYKNSNENIWGSNNILSLYEDKSGIIWIGSQYKGVKKIDPNTIKLRHHLSNNVIHAIWEYEPEIFWVGTDNGVFEYKAVGNAMSYITDKKNKHELHIEDTKVTSILKDKNGYYWFGTYIGLVKYDHNIGTFYTYDTQNSNGISDNRIKHIFEDSGGLLWISTVNGLTTLETKNMNFNKYYQIQGDTSSISDNEIYSVYEDSKNRIWVSTSKGLNFYNRQTDNFSLVLSGLGGINDLTINNVSSVLEDESGKLWIGTLGGGLNSYDIETGDIEHFTEEEGLCDNVIYSILLDNAGNFWLSTGHGLSKFDPVTQQFSNYDIENGLQSMEFISLSAFKSKSGELFFGGINGFNSFFPERIKENRYESPLLITSFKIYNEQQPDNFGSGDTLSLKHFENSFSFEFTSLDFTHYYSNEYEYILEGYEDKWNKTTSAHRGVNYAKVTPGFYSFRVRKTNVPIGFDDKEYFLHLQIIPPWWTTTIFIVSAIILFVILVWLLINTRFQMIRRNHEVEKQIIDSERKALLSQMNPHFIFNSLSSIQNFILKKDELTANRYLGDFSSLMRRILDNSKRENIPLYEEIETIKLYLCLEKMRFTNSFEETLHIDDDLDLFSIKISPMMIQPYLENAILHGLRPKSEDRKLNISITRKDDKRLLFSVIDNGIGRKLAAEIRSRAKTHQSSGMKNIKERIDLHNKIHKTKMDIHITDLYTKKNEACGTKVELLIPYVFD